MKNDFHSTSLSNFYETYAELPMLINYRLYHLVIMSRLEIKWDCGVNKVIIMTGLIPEWNNIVLAANSLPKFSAEYKY